MSIFCLSAFTSALRVREVETAGMVESSPRASSSRSSFLRVADKMVAMLSSLHNNMQFVLQYTGRQSMKYSSSALGTTKFAG